MSTPSVLLDSALLRAAGLVDGLRSVLPLASGLDHLAHGLGDVVVQMRLQPAPDQNVRSSALLDPPHQKYTLLGPKLA